MMMRVQDPANAKRTQKRIRQSAPLELINPETIGAIAGPAKGAKLKILSANRRLAHFYLT